ncbi:MAG: pyruvate, phosphate dikinase [Myxococcota bacterium]
MNQTERKVYRFGEKGSDGDRSLRDLLGGKGANLAEMSRIGLPVPPGFTITTECCRYVSEHKKWPDGLMDEVETGIAHIESNMEAGFGDASAPLLVSVRSGAAVSMPGMMDTVLNLGLNDRVVEGLAKKTGNPRFAQDSYRRFIDMFGNVIAGVPHERFEESLEALKRDRKVQDDVELSAEDLSELVDRYKAVYRKETGLMFPEDPREQLRLAIDAVFKSWDSNRAVKYRRINRITGLIGTAVNVQAMVYGNMGDGSGTGVCFTRDPSTGNPELYGEFLINAQGEDVVAGIRTPRNIAEMKDVLPEAFEQLVKNTTRLEEHYKNMQDIEFTVQEGRLFMLQTRNGKRTGPAALRIALDMVDAGVVDHRTAVSELVTPDHLDQLLHPSFEDRSTDHVVLGKGLPASPGAAVGKVVFTSEAAEEAHARGEDVLLVRVETSPEDVGGMNAARGILTSRGGMTSHAAVVARGWGKPCVAGCSDIVIDMKKQTFTNGSVTVKAGEWISIDGSTGEVVQGRRKLAPTRISEEFKRFMTWVDEFRSMGVRTNADTPADAKRALEFGAEGIGLCRTEHMFFDPERITSMRKMIVSETVEERQRHLDELLPFQRSDFEGIFEAMSGHPVTIRLLDPPLHEFLPHDAEGIQSVSASLGIPPDELERHVNRLHEMNPMMGHRGCRLGMTYPEVTRMQTRAIIEAAINIKGRGMEVKPEIMVPLVGTVAELRAQRQVIEETAEAVFSERGERIEYHIGTMIEIPRAALTAGEIAEAADFFSFGTNDLTQMTFGYSRDDAGSFLPYYVEHRILPHDPFQSLDQTGVGRLVDIASRDARTVKPDLKMGICGEHGGDPHSVTFCYSVGLNYVSCSPFRVPIARLAAAQAALHAAK